VFLQTSIVITGKCSVTVTRFLQKFISLLFSADFHCVLWSVTVTASKWLVVWYNVQSSNYIFLFRILADGGDRPADILNSFISFSCLGLYSLGAWHRTEFDFVDV